MYTKSAPARWSLRPAVPGGDWLGCTQVVQDLFHRQLVAAAKSNQIKSNMCISHSTIPCYKGLNINDIKKIEK